MFIEHLLYPGIPFLELSYYISHNNSRRSYCYCPWITDEETETLKDWKAHS